MSETQFEVGRVYRTRGGDRGLVTGITAGTPNPVHVFMLTGEDANLTLLYRPDGRGGYADENPDDLLPDPLPDATIQAERDELLRWADRLLETLIEGDPDELAADGGITVLDVWREEAKRARAAIAKAEKRNG